MSNRKVVSGPSERLFADVQGDLFEKSYEEKIRAEKNRLKECLGRSEPETNRKNAGWPILG
jgi:hypothetical protein